MNKDYEDIKKHISNAKKDLSPKASRDFNNAVNSGIDVLREKFFDAVAEGQLSFVAQVVDRYPEAVHWMDPRHENKTALHVAVENNLQSTISFLVAHDADVNAVTDRDSTPLMYAAWSGALSTVLYLVGQGADVNVQNIEGVTALMAAAHKGHTDVAVTLIESDADPGLKDSQNLTASDFAREAGHKELAREMDYAAENFTAPEPVAPAVAAPVSAEEKPVAEVPAAAEPVKVKESKEVIDLLDKLKKGKLVR